MSAPDRSCRRARGPRTVVMLALALAVLVALSAGAAPAAAAGRPAKEAPTIVTPGVHAHRVVAYYFHTTYRCATCRKLEAYAREAIESEFAAQLKDGRLVWKTVNVEVEGNEHYVKDYALYTKALVLVNEVRGKPVEWKNLEKVWQLLGNKESFFRYVRDEARAYLAPRS